MYRCRTVADFNCLGWDFLITDTDFVIPDKVPTINYGIAVADFIFLSESITMTVTVTDPSKIPVFQFTMCTSWLAPS